VLLVVADPGVGGINLLDRRGSPGQREDQPAQLRITIERVGNVAGRNAGRLLMSVPEKQHLGGDDRIGLVGPDEEPLHLRVGRQSRLVLGGEQIEAAVADLRVIDRRQGVEDGSLERVTHVGDHGLGGLLGDLAENHGGLTAQLDGSALL
jgi:hypothetical protein